MKKVLFLIPLLTYAMEQDPVHSFGSPKKVKTYLRTLAEKKIESESVADRLLNFFTHHPEYHQLTIQQAVTQHLAGLYFLVHGRSFKAAQFPNRQLIIEETAGTIEGIFNAKLHP